MPLTAGPERAAGPEREAGPDRSPWPVADGGTGVPVAALAGAGISVGDRTLWSDLDLAVRPGEFIAVLGANGSGKSTLLKALLGLQPLSRGRVTVLGHPVRRGNPGVGYIPQQVTLDTGSMVKARDVVRMGVDGQRWGVGAYAGRRARAVWARVNELLESVGAGGFADAPVSMLSGGELQRIRIAQALAGDPRLLLCDEPLAALDLRHQVDVTAMIDARRRSHGTAVLFVTHEINPLLGYVDRVLYLAGGRFRLGPPGEVLTTEGLSDLYRAPVEVLRTHGRIVVVASPEVELALCAEPHDDHLGIAMGRSE